MISLSGISYKAVTRITLLCISLACSSQGAADVTDKARVHINAMEYDQAVRIILAHLQKQPQDVAALHLLARTYAWDNQYAAAEKTYDQLLAIEHDNTQYMFGKAEALIWQNKHVQAVPLLDAVISHVPEQVDAWRLLILALQQSDRQQDQERARQVGIEAKKRFPKLDWDIISN